MIRTASLPLQFLDLDGVITVQPAASARIDGGGFLHYEPGKEKVRRKVRDMLKSLDLDREEDLAAFYTHHGPLLDMNPAPVRWLVNLVGFLMALSLLRQDRNAVFIEDWLLAWLKAAKDQWPDKRRFTLTLAGDGFDVGGLVYALVPYRKAMFRDALTAALDQRITAPWPVFTLPDEWPAIRETILDYAKGQLLENVLRWLSRNLTITASKGTLEARPANLYTNLLLAVAAPLLQPPRGCACGCGQPAAGRSKYAPSHRRRGLTTLTKQQVLDILRKRRRPPHCWTDAQREAARRAVSNAWSRGVRDKEELVRIGEKAARKVAPPPPA